MAEHKGGVVVRIGTARVLTVVALGCAVGIASLVIAQRPARPPRAAPALVLVEPLVTGRPAAADFEAPSAAISREVPPPPDTPQQPPQREHFLAPPTERERGVAPVLRGPSLAVVIDDIGHNLHAPRALLALDAPLTFAILPHLGHSREAARLIRQAGREFIIHMPMEPERFPEDDPGPRPLLRGLSEEQTLLRLRGYLSHLPGAVGASNHMGSAYTDDAAKMALVQRVLAERRLLFLNSKTSSTIVPGRIAGRERYAYLERDLFLDHTRTLGAIRGKLEAAVQLALRNGRAVVIGHPYRETLRVLREGLPRLEDRGVRLVSLTELNRQ